MKQSIERAGLLFGVLALAVAQSACSSRSLCDSQSQKDREEVQSSQSSQKQPASSEQENRTMKIQAGNRIFNVIPADTAAAQALCEKLYEGPVELTVHAWGGFEKTGPLPFSLPADDRQIEAQPGDLMLYQQDQISMFYGTNTWAYTPLGTVEDTEAWIEFLKSGPDEITLTL